MNTSAIKEPGHSTCATQHTIIVTPTLNWYHFRQFHLSIPLLRKSETFWDASCSVSQNFQSCVFDLAECIPHPSDCLWICLYFVAALHNVESWRRDLVVRDLYHIAIDNHLFTTILCTGRQCSSSQTRDEKPMMQSFESKNESYRSLPIQGTHNSQYWFKVIARAKQIWYWWVESQWIVAQRPLFHVQYPCASATFIQNSPSAHTKKRNSDFVNEIQGC